MESTSGRAGSVEVTVVPTVFDMAHGFSVRLRRKRPVSYFLAMGLGLLLAVGMVLLFVVTSGTRGASDGESGWAWIFVVAAAYLVLIVPFLRHLVWAALLRLMASGLYTPYRIVSIGDSSMSVVSSLGESVSNFGTFDDRYETSRAFVMARATERMIAVVPKRAFGDAGTLEAFRAAFFASSPVVVQSVYTLGEADDGEGFRYRRTPAEHRRGIGLILRRSPIRFVRYVAWVVLALVALQFLRQLSGEPAGSLAFYVAVIVVVVAIGRRKAEKNLLAMLRDEHLHVDAEGLRVESAAGSLAVAYGDVRRLEQDELVFVVVLDRNVGLILPKRAVPAPALEEIRRRP